MAEKLKEFDLDSYIECWGRLYVLKVKISKPFLLDGILNMISREGTKVLSYANKRSDEKVDMSLIVGARDVGELTDVVRDLLEIEGVEHVSYGELPYKAIPLKYYPLRFHGMRIVIFGEPVLKSIVEGIKKEYGKTAGPILLWNIGYQGGLGVAKEFKEKYKFENIEDYFAMLRLRGIVLGWFVISHIDIHLKNNIIVLRMTDNWECNMVKGKFKTPQSHFVRGIISGFASYILGKNMVAKEIKCIAKGDNYCEFIVLEKHKSGNQYASTV